MNTKEIEEKISFTKNGTVKLENAQFNVGKKTSALNLQTSGQIKDQGEFLCFTKTRCSNEESDCWLNFNSNENYYNFARTIYDFYEAGKSEIAIKNIEKFGANHHWCKVKDTKILFWWLKEDTLGKFKSLTDVEGKNLTKVEL